MHLKATVAALLAALAASAPAGADEATFDCLMDPPVITNLGSAASGLLETVDVRRGDSVTAGQQVASLDSAFERATVELLDLRASSTAGIDAAKARLDFLTTQLERTRELFQRNVTTQDLVDQATAEHIAGESALRQAELDRETAARELARAKETLAERIIRSPIDGIVVSRNMSPGEFVTPDSQVVTIVQLDPLYIETFLPVVRFGSIAVGDVGIVHPLAPVEGSYEATVTAIDQVFDPASGTFGLRLELSNSDGELPGGHRCKVELTFREAG